ncbi:MAG: nucleoside-diphosphate kinase [Deltaproteobacteria bacterium]|nr:MAG: nucleoside-diphosphate kinase [Deltaproteobacteria bacterium]RLB01823.1 MAG: nucleoside-diphosphate kinase [Deltaproteobacteria bacterium]
MERTLAIVKPDGVRKGLIGEVIRRFEAEGLRVVALKMLQMSKEEAEGFYAVHRGKSFYEGLTRFMSSGPVVVMVLEGEGAIERVRGIMGATDPQKAAPGTIRRLYADNVQENIVHGSDSPESAAFEIPYFFSAIEICS